jgi:hypothetical protein
MIALFRDEDIDSIASSIIEDKIRSKIHGD